jgi:hypothetical protein
VAARETSTNRSDAAEANEHRKARKAQRFTRREVLAGGVAGTLPGLLAASGCKYESWEPGRAGDHKA